MRSGSIDALKCLFAFMVVIIHTESVFRTPTNSITACAVPGFFLISGYFIFGDRMEDKLIRSLKKIIKITIWSSAVYAFLYFVKYLHHGMPPILTIETLYRVLLYNENPFIYHLWYLNAYIYVLIIMIIATKLGVQKKIMLLMPILIVADICLGRYSHLLIGKDFGLVYIYGWLHDGLPYFLLGGFIKIYTLVPVLGNKNIRVKSAICFLLIISCIAAIVEQRLPLSDGDKFASTVFLTISLFLFFNIIHVKDNNLFAKIGKRDSLYIYIYHPLTIDILVFINAKTDILHGNIYPIFSPIIVFTLTELSIYAYYLLSNIIVSKK